MLCKKGDHLIEPPNERKTYLTDQLLDLDYGRLLVASKRLTAPPDWPVLKGALLSDAATQQLVPILKVLLHRNGIRGEIYEGPFDAIELEAYIPCSGLYAFTPDAVVILNATQALRTSYSRRTEGTPAFVAETAGKTSGVWDAIRSHSRAAVLQSTFVLPGERLFGNFDRKTPQSFYSATLHLNAAIAEGASERSGVLIHDVDALASWIGRKQFFDDRFWDMWKSFCSLEHLPRVAQHIVDVLMAMRGRMVKCVVCDLDNTLWGGVIGDDGVNGISINAHGDGECFYRFQSFLKELLRRGILLAVSSKNEETNALLPFDQHPEMVLKRDDFTVFAANWRDKAENIRSIQETLNIGFDSIVFLDDNPFERNLVRELLPKVIVPELPEDPAEFVSYLSELNLFETTSFSAEDLHRAEMYKREAERHEAAAAFGSVDEFLTSLDLRIVGARFDEFHLPRIAQLIQRSNQFNLTTHRHTEADCEVMMDDYRILPLYAKLSDRLGDQGLISVIVLEPRDDELVIRDWLMSCRVLMRGVEQYMMNEIAEHALRLGLARVKGEYIPTAKNGMVRDFYGQLGFTRIAEDSGHASWVLDV